MALREIIASFGIHVDDKEVEHASKSVQNLVDGLKGIVEGAIAFKVGEFFLKWVAGATTAAVEIGHMSERLNINTNDLQQWLKVADLAGVGADEFSASIGILQRNAAAAAEGGKEQLKHFQELGVSVKDGMGNLKDPSELLEEVADGLKNTTNDTKRTALALNVLGRGGKALGPLLKDGAEGIRKAKEEFAGKGFSKDFIEQSHIAEQNSKRFGYALNGLRNQFAFIIQPIQNAVTQGLTKIVLWLKEASKHTNILMLALGAFGIATSIAFVRGATEAMKMFKAFRVTTLGLKKAGEATELFGGALGKIGTGVAVIGLTALVLIAEDLYTYFTGGDSAIGHLIEVVKQDLRGTWVESLVETIKEGYDLAIKWAKVLGLIKGEDKQKQSQDQENKQNKLDEYYIKTGRKLTALPQDLDPSKIAGDDEAHQKERRQEVEGRRSLQRLDRLREHPEEDFRGGVYMQPAAQRIGVPAALSTNPGINPSLPGSTVNSSVTINVNAPNADPTQVAKKVNDGMSDALKKAMATRQRAATP